ncbi:MAG TPA: YciI family protein [Longimicrobium sp.]|nr:YciI family protein [Longimicrobium sp.]
MRFMIMFKADGDNEAAGPACFLLPEMGRFIDQLRDDGVLLATEGLQPSSSNAARVRRSGGKVTHTDGPFAEAKELVAGFVVVDVPSKDAAVELTERFLAIAGDANAEVREVIERH